MIKRIINLRTIYGVISFMLQPLHTSSASMMNPEIGLDSAVANRKLPAPADNRNPIVQLIAYWAVPASTGVKGEAYKLHGFSVPKGYGMTPVQSYNRSLKLAKIYNTFPAACTSHCVCEQ